MPSGPISGPIDEAKGLADELNGLLFAISHDLRAPVRAITGFTQLLRDHTATADVGITPETQHYLARIETAGAQLQQMLEGLTQLARLSQHPPALHALDVRALCLTVQQEAAQRHELALELDVDDPLMSTGDPALLRMALLALIDNAWKFSRHVTNPSVRLTAQYDGHHITLCVSDNGMGFDMRYQDRLGVPFQRLHAQKELTGTGMGLAIVRRIAALHHGHMFADSTPNVGSRLGLRWPIKKADHT